MEKVETFCLVFLKNILYNDKRGMRMNKKRIWIIGIEIVALIALYIFVNSKYLAMIPKCWVYQTTGLLCPACGGTTCIINLLQGNWYQAFCSHMVFFIGILYLLSINIVYLINLEKEKKVGTWIYPKYWYAIIFVVVLIIYTIIRNLL